MSDSSLSVKNGIRGVMGIYVNNVRRYVSLRNGIKIVSMHRAYDPSELFHEDILDKKGRPQLRQLSWE